MSNPEIMVKIGAEASGINAGVNQSNAALERLVQEVQRSNSQMQQGFMQSSLALREIARASGETAEKIGSMGSQAKPATSGMVLSFGAIGLAISGIKQSVELVGQAIKVSLGPSAQMQQLQVQFGVLLGSTKDAKDRMQELVKFADTTPFELPEVAKASKILETLTKGALSTGEGLRLVGDVASATGQPIDELATWFGRLYDSLQPGRPVGEAMQRLQELGAVSGDTRAEIERLQKEGKKGPEVWDVAKKSFEQYSGMMDAQSKTFEGLASTMDDSLGGVLREFGDQILPDASGATGDLTGMFNDLKPAAAALGWVVGSTVKVFREAFLLFKALGQQVLPMLAADFAMNIADMLSKLIGFAEKVNGLFGTLLPESWTKGIGDGLASAKEWSNGVSTSMREVGDTARKELGDVGDQMLNVYATPEDIDVPGKKKGKKAAGGGPSDKEKKDAEKAAEEAEAMRLKEAALDDKLAAKRIKSAQEQEELRIASITDEVEREREKRSAQYQEEVTKAQGNKALLLAVNAKYAQDLQEIDRKAEEKKSAAIKKEVEDRKKAYDEELSAGRTWGKAWEKEVTDRIKGQQTAFQVMAKSLSGMMDGITNSLASGITGAITRTKSLTAAIKDVGREILQSVVGGIVKAGLQWVETEVMKATIGKAMMAASLAATVPMATAQAAIWSAPASLATIATFGGAAAAAPEAIMGSLAMTKALALPSFDIGTPTVPHDMVAQIHKGETIVPATFAEGIRRGEMTLGGPGGGNAQTNHYGGPVTIHINGAGGNAQSIAQEVARVFPRAKASASTNRRQSSF